MFSFLVLFPLTSGALNVARVFGTDLVAGEWTDFGWYLLGLAGSGASPASPTSTLFARPGDGRSRSLDIDGVARKEAGLREARPLVAEGLQKVTSKSYIAALWDLQFSAHKMQRKSSHTLDEFERHVGWNRSDISSRR
jgi:hypothetical protein